MGWRVTAQTDMVAGGEDAEGARHVVEAGRAALVGHQHRSPIRHKQFGLLALGRFDIGARRGRSTVPPARRTSDVAVAEDAGFSRSRLPRRRGRDQGLAVAVLDPGIAALQRAVGMGELGDPPERVEPLARRGVRRIEQAGPKRAGGLAELAPGAVEPAAQRPRQPLGEIVEPLPLRREQGLALGPAAEQACELLAAALGRAPGAALRPVRRARAAGRAVRRAPAPPSRPRRSASARARRRRNRRAWCRSRGRRRR